MQSADHPLVEARLEAICQKGCRTVQLDIARIEQGDELPETRGLTAAERLLLLAELKQIMAVYGDSCPLG